MKVKQQETQQNLSFNSYWLEFVKTCLRPLVRILVKHKVEFKSVNNLLRELYVEEGESYIKEVYRISAPIGGKIERLCLHILR